MKTFFILATILLVSFATMFFPAAAAACRNVPSMKIEDACAKAFPEKSNSSAYYAAACKAALQSAPDPGELTTYALTVARKASLKCASTINTLNVNLGAFKDRQREDEEAMVYCRDMYEQAYDLMESGAAHLSGCDLVLAEGKFSSAASNVGGCLTIVEENASVSSWIADLVKPGYDLTLVVENLAYLLVPPT